MKVLHLTLKKKWFDMILSGQKNEEYREIKPYWVRRLIEPTDEDVKVSDVIYYLNKGEADHFKSDQFRFKYFDVVRFKNGYNKDAPMMDVECLCIQIGMGMMTKGAPKDKEVFVISLGEIFNTSKPAAT